MLLFSSFFLFSSSSFPFHNSTLWFLLFLLSIIFSYLSSLPIFFFFSATVSHSKCTFFLSSRYPPLYSCCLSFTNFFSFYFNSFPYNLSQTTYFNYIFISKVVLYVNPNYVSKCPRCHNCWFSFFVNFYNLYNLCNSSTQTGPGSTCRQSS